MPVKQQHGLGRGLGALLGEQAAEATQLRKPVGYINKEVTEVAGAVQQTAADVTRISVDLIDPNPYQPRTSFDADALEELAESIRALGLIQPITVRRKGTRYQIISGERRFRASRLAGMDAIPAYVRETGDQGMLEMAIVENIQREDLDPIEVALSYQRLIDECQLTQEQMALRVGKKRASVANSLRLLKLPARIQRELKAGTLSTGHAKVILAVEDPAVQEALCESVIRNGLSVRQLEEAVKALTEKTPAKAAKVETGELPDDFYKVLEIVGKFFENNISLKRTATGKGTMTVRFNSDEEVSRFLAALEQANL